MATLFDLAQAYLNRALPETFKYDRTQPPTIGPVIPVQPEPIKQLPVQGDDNFSVYNPDPNTIRDESNYNERAYMKANPSEFFDLNNPNEMSGLDPKQLTGIPGAIQSYMKNSIPGQLIGSAVRGIESLLPVNPRAKLENELLGSGIMLDDIGRVVSNDYNTAEGIMAGYNAAKVTDKTFDKRRNTIEKTLGTKYGLSKSQIEAAKKDPNYKGPGADLVNRLGLLDESQDLFGDARTRTKDILQEEYKQDPKYQFTGPNVQGDFKSILGTKPITKYRDPIMDMVSPPAQISLENIIEQNKAKQKMQDLINMSGTADDIDNDPFFKDATADSGTIMSDANTKTKTKTKTKTPSFNIHGGGDGPVERPGPSKSKSVSKTNKDYGQFGRRQQQTSQGGGAGNSSGGCFLKGTLITMLDGTKKPVEQVDLGNEVAIGGKVFATGKFLVKNLHDYKGIKVSGSHMVSENNKWVRVEDSKHGKLLDNEEHTVYVFGSENRRILINDILFTDYFEVNEQDKLMNNEEDFFDNWKLYAKQDSGNNVDIINAS
jgi:hypothetical protein